MQKFQPFSLALGGGAARWLAHIGVIRRLEELEILPEAISGTSMGAVIATFYALGFSSREMTEIAQSIKILKLIDLDFIHGFVKWEKIVAFLKQYVWTLCFEDTKIPLTMIATDIDTGEKIIFREGKLIDALRATISIPGIFAPYAFRKRNLVDGGLVENLPISILPKIATIAVSVQIKLEKKKKNEDFFSKLFARSMIVNGYSILRNTIAIALAQNEQYSLASRKNVLLIKPERYDIDYYDFTQVEALIQSGYRASTSIESFLS